MTLGAWLALALLGSTVLGCAETSSLAGPAELAAATPTCPLDVRARKICSELGRVSVLRAPGGRVGVRTLECKVDLPLVYLQWSLPELGAEPFEVALRFGAPEPRDVMIPAELEQVLYAWPCGERCLPELLVEVPVFDACSAAAAEGSQIVPLAASNSTSCVGESWSFGSDPRWCRTEPEFGTTILYVRRWASRSAAPADVYSLEVSDERADARVHVSSPGAREGDFSTPAEALRPVVDALWPEPTHRERSCNDGGAELIEFRRGEAWKVVIRKCSSPLLDLRQLRFVHAESYGY